VVRNLKEYFRLGRVFNAEILALILVLSYLLSAYLYNIIIDLKIVFLLFLGGMFAHIWGGYNNDRLDLSIDKQAYYCKHKPLVSGSIKLQTAKIIEICAALIFIICILYASLLSTTQVSNKIFSYRFFSTILYLFCALALAYLYNKYNKSNMFINVFGQFYASFAVLLGMSIIVDYDIILVLTAVVIGLNGVYLNIIEADLKDVEGDIINVPKALGVIFKMGKVEHIGKFYLVNESIKVTMFILIISILILQEVPLLYFLIACSYFLLNCIIRVSMFIHLSTNREKMKHYIAAQELSSILLIGTIFMILHPFTPLFLVLFISLWLISWNKALWNTYVRPQV